MELFFLYFFLGFILLILVLLQTFFYKHRSLSSSTKLPPGRMGWPIFGETFQYLSTGFKGHPEKFVIDRMKKYSQECFKTNILGQHTAILCSSAGNKFLFSNENKLVKTWWPESVNKLFPSNLQTNSNEEGKNLRKLLPQFLKVEALQRYISVMDTISHTHFAHEWENKEEVLVFPLAKKYTFWLACRLFLSVEDPKYIARFADPFHLMAAGIFSIPIDFPGTAYSKAIKAAKVIRNDLRLIIKQRKIDLAEKKATPTQDILSHMLTTSDENGKYMTEEDIADKIIALLIGGHDTTSVVITAIVNYLAELPHVYNAVYEEQMAIAKSKGLGELLSYEDIQKMKYSWNVACEALRLVPPVQGAFREAMTDIMYSGFTIPKGWKFYWSAYATHLNPQYFADPVKFDPTRFEGSGPAPYTYVPFGGGPRMCPGKEYARFEILAFMHNLVKRFRWEKVYPDENFKAVPLPMPTKGLPIRLIPHTTIE